MNMQSYCKRLLRRRKRKFNSLQKKRNINPELIHAARVAKLIRTITCAGPIFLQPDRGRFRKIAKFLLQKVIRADKISAPGTRNVMNGGLHLLEKYELNDNIPLSEILQAPYTSSINTNDGLMRVYFPSFKPSKQIICPDNATHCRIIAVGASLNFNYYNATIESDTSPLIPLIEEQVPGFSMNLPVSPRDGHAMMLVLGISYIHLPTYNGEVVPLCQAAQILRIESNLTSLPVKGEVRYLQ
ncbi:hypothetical protein [Chitinophaga silvisoli]|uniref:Uncharacterized protein n=1 Tax=Chitinophaga silvisoli TaxID=2291814 RepID=A0A3E1NKE3_9BACT|nr:hypothetical protein [Chitinophaga silvisoli]RFM28407.1 hypothetical protein DXN04_34165 [Chitinophaga silvisoli]